MNKHRAFIAQQRKLYDDLVAAQGAETCAICGREPVTRRLNIDHDHKTMEVRGLLCHRCNRKLPYDVDAGWLRAAADYLDNPPLAEAA